MPSDKTPNHCATRPLPTMGELVARVHAQFDYLEKGGLPIVNLYRLGAWGMRCVVRNGRKYVQLDAHVSQDLRDRGQIDSRLLADLRSQIENLRVSTALVLYDPPIVDPPETVTPREMRRALLRMLGALHIHEGDRLWRDCRTVLLGAGFAEDGLEDLLNERLHPESTIARRSRKRKTK